MRRPALIFLAVLLAAQAARTAVLNWTTPELTRGGTVIVADVGRGPAVFSQTFDVRSGGLEAIHVGVARAGDRGVPPSFGARLIEVDAGGSERALRDGPLAWSDGETCCVFRFEPIADSARRRYRFELRVPADAPGGAGLRATAASGTGGLIINGRPQPSNLQIRVEGAELAPLRGARRFGLGVVLGTFAIADGAILWIVFGLVSASGRRPS